MNFVGVIIGNTVYICTFFKDISSDGFNHVSETVNMIFFTDC